MLLEGFAYERAVPVIVFHCLDLEHSPQCFKGLVVELVNVGHVRIGNHDEWQCLHVAETVRKPLDGQPDAKCSAALRVTWWGAHCAHNWPS